MSSFELKVPFGPSVALKEGEFLAVTRHRLMMFFYIGLCFVIVASSVGDGNTIATEIRLALAAMEILPGVLVLLLGAQLEFWLARRAGRHPVVHLGTLLVATVSVSILTSVILKHLVLGLPIAPPLELAVKLIFYVVLTEILTSLMMQATLQGILADVRNRDAFWGRVGQIGLPDEPRDLT